MVGNAFSLVLLLFIVLTLAVAFLYLRLVPFSNAFSSEKALYRRYRHGKIVSKF